MKNYELAKQILNVDFYFFCTNSSFQQIYTSMSFKTLLSEGISINAQERMQRKEADRLLAEAENKGKQKRKMTKTRKAS